MQFKQVLLQETETYRFYQVTDHVAQSMVFRNSMIHGGLTHDSKQVHHTKRFKNINFFQAFHTAYQGNQPWQRTN